ncbi:hypothetical protein [Streptomyces sp. V1I1]|nr:hypothetical protein [Streptomyces sp. V1I1]MDQ0945357.1 hypothetical protein [Streptomyces sp. V1I1]
MSSNDVVSLSWPYDPETVAEANAQILVGPWPVGGEKDHTVL